MQQLWGLINTLQVLTCLPLFDLLFPPNALLVLTLMQDTANFQVGFIQSLLDTLLSTFYTLSYQADAKYSSLGFPSTSLIQNLGMVLLFGTVLILVVTLLGLLLFMSKWFPR